MMLTPSGDAPPRLLLSAVGAAAFCFRAATFVTTTGWSVTPGLSKLQLATQGPSGLIATPQIQSLPRGSCKTMRSVTRSQMETCMSSPPVARKRESADHDRHRTPAGHSNSDTASNARSTWSVATARSSRPTASSLPEGENATACTPPAKGTETTRSQPAPSGRSRQTIAFISLSCGDLVASPWRPSAPQPPARRSPAGAKAMQCRRPSCCRPAISVMSGTDSSTAFFAVVVTASSSLGLDTRAIAATSPCSVVDPASFMVSACQTLTQAPASPAATYLPLGA
mmetsp:Transcript_7408/g.23248  ORF Transcript_7408/g.23248 Transcript_7408/m.23248 type:complete len:283 (+) Transcript_7408:47-895(+)